MRTGVLAGSGLSGLWGCLKKPPPLLIRGGTLVTSSSQRRADVRIREGRIVELGSSLKPDGEKVLEADGLHVLPGGVDPHVHVVQHPAMPAAFRYADTIESASRAALAGGITTVGNMTWIFPGEDAVSSLDRLEGFIERESFVDFFHHPIFLGPDSKRVEDVGRLVDAGHTSLKVFFSTRDYAERRETFQALMKAAWSKGAIVLVHCEEHAQVEKATESLFKAGKKDFAYFAQTRPVEAEVSSIREALDQRGSAGDLIYVVHLSSAEGLSASRDRPGVFLETRPIYLALTAEEYAKPDPALLVVQPPLREKEDLEALWAGLSSGAFHTVGSDHVGWSRQQKLDPSLNLRQNRPGVPDLEIMLPLLMSEGVGAGRITLEQFVALTSTHPAKLFGLYPAKGDLSLGAQADLVLWDLKRRAKIDENNLQTRAGYTPYQGMTLKGWPEVVLREGQLAWERGHFHGRVAGRVLRRSLPAKV